MADEANQTDIEVTAELGGGVPDVDESLARDTEVDGRALESGDVEDVIGRAGEAGRRDDEDTVDADGDEVVSGGDAREVLTRVANASVWGVMVVQYPERDVRVSMDGDAALRLLAMYAGAPVRGYEDRVDLGVCDARCSWVGVDVARALGLFWVPSELLAAGRTTIDPVPAGVAV